MPTDNAIGRFVTFWLRRSGSESVLASGSVAGNKRIPADKGTIVNLVLTAALSSTKRKDPDAHQVKKGNVRHFE